MTFNEFVDSVTSESAPPHGLPTALEALWWSRKGDWHKAHQVSQDAGSKTGDWVHAHLHRVEGDQSNAAYWYSRAEREHPHNSTEEEWEQIARELIASQKDQSGPPDPPIFPKG